MKNAEIYTWRQFEKDARKIAAWAKKRKIKNVYGIPRGGLVLAVKLSHILGIPLVLAKKDITSQTLVVDDTIDSGSSIKTILASSKKNFSVASIYLDKTSSFAPHFYLRQKENWVVFPWETNKSSRRDGTV